MVFGLKPMGKPSTQNKNYKVLDRTQALHGPRTQAYGETKYAKEKLQVLDRTNALYGPRTQAYGETKYSNQKLQSFGQNPGLAWSSDSSLGGNQVLKQNYKFWTEPRPCMVLGLKLVGKPSTQIKNYKVLDRTKAMHGPRTQAYGETKYAKQKLQSFG